MVVTQFRRAGGIPLVRGNIPQGCQSMHCENYVFGGSKNPHNKFRSLGGSSGGDAGLIATQCVPLALGNDIGGSLRWPPGFCGVYGLKPSLGRVSRLGLTNALKSRRSTAKNLASVVGPMGSSVSDLIVAMQVLCDMRIHKDDPDAIPYGWKMDKALSEFAVKSSVRVGIL